MASYVAPSTEWDDHGDAVTEMSVAPARRGAEAQSGWAPRPPVASAGGYSADELAAIAAEEDGAHARGGCLRPRMHVVAASPTA